MNRFLLLHAHVRTHRVFLRVRERFALVTAQALEMRYRAQRAMLCLKVSLLIAALRMLTTRSFAFGVVSITDGRVFLFLSQISNTVFAMVMCVMVFAHRRLGGLFSSVPVSVPAPMAVRD